MTADGNYRPDHRGRAPAHSVPPGYPAAGGPVGPGGPPTPPPLKPTWWVLPFTGGALAVILVAAVVIFYPRSSPAAKPNPATSARSTAQAAPLPAQMFPNTLFSRLTGYLQSRNETGFLHLASAQARSAMMTWWENLNAVGFTTGAVIPTANQDTVSINRQGNGTTVVLAGVHSPLDPVGDNGKPDVALAHYRIGLHFSSASAIGQIISWKPLDDAPWDAGTKLYVRKGPHVVVAGLPSDAALVDQALPIAEDAASYDIGLVNHVNFQELNQQQGFIVFVSGDATVGNGWFAGDKQPPGWPPQFFGAQVFQLPGPGTSPVDVDDAGRVSDGSTGGARVVIEPYRQDPNGGTPRSQVLTLVRDFILAILATHDENLANGIATSPVPSWSEEGFAVAVQSLYDANTNPAPASYDFSKLTAALQSLPPSYKTGAVPTSASQLFGPAITTDETWNDVAASGYEYIEQKYGMGQMLAAAMLLWTRYSTPFGNVLQSSSNGTYTFYTASIVQAGWSAWLAAHT